ncbi:MAG TPA: C13 family peptidase [Geobacteraceae bacterium]
MENGIQNQTVSDAGSAVQSPEPEIAPVRAGERTGNPWRNLLRNLRCGVRLALLSRVTIDELRVAPGDLALLAVTDLAFNLFISFLLVGSGGSLAFSTFPSFFCHLPLMLLVGLLAGRCLSRPILTTAVPVALVALSVPLELCHGALEGMMQLPRLGWLSDYLAARHYYRFFWWWVAAAAIFLARLGPAPKIRRAAAVILFLALLATPFWFFPRGDLWVSAAESPEGGELHLTEEVLSAQARLLDEQLAGLLPGERGAANLYFVGFAGDASQDVFTRELTAVERLFAERFGTDGRAVTLANNPRTATTLPFATAANLGRALERVGHVMNRDEDVLFLFLTSHGSPEQVLAVDNPPLELDGLTPEMVRRMLKKSGITWKVIVVSACYAGGFIDPLKDDHTLIVTAADASHESFGCQNGEGFTWFGRAYFDEALRHTRSFTAAFARARETIRQWEKREGETPSNPQIWVGKAMERKLACRENRRAAGTQP